MQYNSLPRNEDRVLLSELEWMELKFKSPIMMELMSDH